MDIGTVKNLSDFIYAMVSTSDQSGPLFPFFHQLQKLKNPSCLIFDTRKSGKETAQELSFPERSAKPR